MPELEVWEADSFVTVNTSGKTCPMQIDCSHIAALNGLRLKKSLLVKSVGHPEVTPLALCCEFVGNILAQHFGIRTPQPAIVELSPEFVGAMRSHPEVTRNRINLQTGFGVGVEYLRGLAAVERNVVLQLPRELAQAAPIYAFDMLVQNPDRTRERKTNCAWRNGNLLAFDFEMCFSFVLVLFAATEPWQVDPQMARDHLFHPSLRGKVHDWSGFMTDLAALSDGKIEQLFASLRYHG